MNLDNLLSPQDILRTKPHLRRLFVDKELTKMNNKHPYYYQVQFQMRFTRRKYCLFATYTPKGIKYNKIRYNEKFCDDAIPKVFRF